MDQFVPDSMPAFQRGLELFDDGYFREAHEAWEDGWRASSDPAVRALLRGLAQAAAALHHRSRGNRRGAARIAVKAFTRLEAARQQAPELEIISVIEQLRALTAEVGPAPRAHDRGAPLVPSASPVLLSSEQARDARGPCDAATGICEADPEEIGRLPRSS